MRIVEALAHQPGASTSQSTPPLTFATDIHAARKSALPTICPDADAEAELETEAEME